MGSCSKRAAKCTEAGGARLLVGDEMGDYPRLCCLLLELQSKDADLVSRTQLTCSVVA